MSRERIQKAFSRMGLGPRRGVERALEAGEIRKEGVVQGLGDTTEPGEILVWGTRTIVVAPPDLVTRVLIYHKPIGEICTRIDPLKRRTVFAALPPAATPWVGIGRLDYNTTGLLLFTNQGNLAHRMMHPRFELQRVYQVHVERPLTPDIVKRLCTGVMLEDSKIPCACIAVEPDPTMEGYCYRVVLAEGRNRAVRRIFLACRRPVLHLKRIQYGPIHLPDTLLPGTAVLLGAEDIATVLALVDRVPGPQAVDTGR